MTLTIEAPSKIFKKIILVFFTEQENYLKYMNYF